DIARCLRAALSHLQRADAIFFSRQRVYGFCDSPGTPFAPAAWRRERGPVPAARQATGLPRPRSVGFGVPTSVPRANPDRAKSSQRQARDKRKPLGKFAAYRGALICAQAYETPALPPELRRRLRTRAGKLQAYGTRVKRPHRLKISVTEGKLVDQKSRLPI